MALTITEVGVQGRPLRRVFHGDPGDGRQEGVYAETPTESSCSESTLQRGSRSHGYPREPTARAKLPLAVLPGPCLMSPILDL